MGLPSIQQLYSGLLTVVKRFPIQFICALTATVCWCWYINLSNANSANASLGDYLIRGVLMSNLALALLLALDLYAEMNNIPMGKKWLFRVAGSAFCILLFFVLSPEVRSSDIYRIALFAFAFHLLVSFAPFTGKNNMGGFWQFNKILFLRFLTSALYSAVLYTGLSIALFAIKGLFNIDIDWKIYMQLFVVIAAGFNTIFFLAGVPADLHLLREDKTYPKGLKIFTQFVLIPLMTIYLAILLVYELKIILSWELPKGIVSSLILGYAVFGILSLLLVNPIKDSEGNAWIKLFSRLFYVMMIPLIVLLILAVWKRVSHYGITESRYILIILALWLTGITVYFLASKRQNIKMIPISLCILALLTIYGPQSAFSISKNSQLSRLKKIITSKKTADQSEKTSIIRYLVEAHGLEALQPFTTKNLREIGHKIDRQNIGRYAQKRLKTDTTLSLLNAKDGTNNSGIFLKFINEDSEVLKVSGYDYMIDLGSSLRHQEFKMEDILIETYNDQNGGRLIINIDHQTIMKLDLYAIFQKAALDFKNGVLRSAAPNEGYYYPAKLMRFSKIYGQYQYTVVVTSLTNTFYYDGSQNNSFTGSTGYLLIKKLKP